MHLTIEIPDDLTGTLRARAERLGVTCERLVEALLRDLLGQSDETFERVAADVLRKNGELYRRLA